MRKSLQQTIAKRGGKDLEDSGSESDNSLEK